MNTLKNLEEAIEYLHAHAVHHQEIIQKAMNSTGKKKIFWSMWEDDHNVLFAVYDSATNKLKNCLHQFKRGELDETELLASSVMAVQDTLFSEKVFDFDRFKIESFVLTGAIEILTKKQD